MDAIGHHVGRGLGECGFHADGKRNMCHQLADRLIGKPRPLEMFDQQLVVESFGLVQCLKFAAKLECQLQKVIFASFGMSCNRLR